MELKDFLKEHPSYSDESFCCIMMNRVANLISEENIEMRNTLYDCVEMYCKAHKLEMTQESVLDCMVLIIEIGLTRHIIKNINNFDLYGYGYYREVKKDESK